MNEEEAKETLKTMKENIDKKYLIPGETIENKDIKTIVTHEQFESIEYKVEEEK